MSLVEAIVSVVVGDRAALGIKLAASRGV